MGKIKVYPTLIDSYKLFLATDFMTLDDIIDRINRVKRPMPPAADKGTAYNDLIDMLISGRQPETRQVATAKFMGTVYRVKGELTEYEFDKKIADRIAHELRGSEFQVFTKGDINTPFGDVELYGYVDYVNRDTVTDLKTGKSYTFPKYMNNSQHFTYLYTLRQQGIKVDRAIYLMTDFRGIYIEDYYWNKDAETKLRGDVCDFLDFVDRYRDRIIDKKVLGQTD